MTSASQTHQTGANSTDLSSPSRAPRILLIGAGAVGQTYGYHLRRGGAEVTFFVKEKYRAGAETGFVMHEHRPLGRPDSFRFNSYRILSDIERVAERQWDQVWLCISSPALQGSWLAELCANIGQATLVSLQPGLEDLELLAQTYDPAKIVAGAITFIAYQTPLAGEKLAEGVAYLLPPIGPTPFAPLQLTDGPSDPDLRCAEVVAALNRGGCAAQVDPNAPELLAFAGAILNPIVAGLEIAGWSLKRLRKSPTLEIATAAAKEAQRVAARYHGAEIPVALNLVRRPEILGTALRIAPHLMPFDLEVYLKYHFSKVGAQTRQIIDRYIRISEELPIVIEDEFGELSERVIQTRALRVLRNLLPPGENNI